MGGEGPIYVQAAECWLDQVLSTVSLLPSKSTCQMKCIWKKDPEWDGYQMIIYKELLKSWKILISQRNRVRKYQSAAFTIWKQNQDRDKEEVQRGLAWKPPFHTIFRFLTDSSTQLKYRRGDYLQCASKEKLLNQGTAAYDLQEKDESIMKVVR